MSPVVGRTAIEGLRGDEAMMLRDGIRATDVRAHAEIERSTCQLFGESEVQFVRGAKNDRVVSVGGIGRQEAERILSGPIQ